MHIVFIGTTIGASLNFRGSLIKKCIQEGHRVTLLATDYTEQTRTQVSELGAIPLNNPLNRASFNPIDDIMGCYKLYKLIKEIKADCVFSFFVKPVIFGTISAKCAGVKHIVCMIEGLGYFFTKRPIRQSIISKVIKWIQVYLYSISLPLANKVILLNPDDNKDLIESYKIKVKSLHILGGIGVPLDAFQYTPITNIDHITFLFVGRVLVDKGVFEFIRAAYNIKKIYPMARFKIVGDIDPNNPASLSQDKFIQLKDDNVVEFCGFQINILSHLQNCHVFVLPSYREGVPLSVQEAMAVGRPIITSFVPGCKETIINGDSGYFVEPFCADSLAEKMMTFIDTPHLASEMGIRAHERAKTLFNRDEKDNELLNIITNGSVKKDLHTNIKKKYLL